MDPETLVALVVEDEESVRKVVLRLLSRDPRIQTREAEDGFAALRVLEAEPVDLVISDEKMPQINGLRLLETIKGRWPGTRRALYSGHVDASLLLSAVNRGGVHKVLQKGTDVSVLRAELEELVEECFQQRLGAGRDSIPFSAAEPGAGDALCVQLMVAELATRGHLQRALMSEGFTVRVERGSTADSPADVYVLDITPETDIEAELEAIRKAAGDAPVVALVGRAEVQRGHEAMRLGAHRYLVHPVSREALRSTTRTAGILARVTKIRRATDAASEIGIDDTAELGERFDRALEQLYMAFQPIVDWDQKTTYGVEALLRSTEATMGNPGLILEAAQRLERMGELGRCVRRSALTAFPALDAPRLFLNLHVTDVLSDDLLSSPLADIADRVVLEITERASLESVPELATRLSMLQAQGYRVAIDDLGAGYAALSAFATLNPDIVKIDMSLIRGIDQSWTKRRLVKSLQEVCGDLGIAMVAEGVETPQERDVLVASGCELFQGYLFARPAREPGPVRWSP